MIDTPLAPREVADAATAAGPAGDAGNGLVQHVAPVAPTRLAFDKEIQRSIAHLAAIVESSDDAIIGKTLDGIIRSWNTGAQRLFGYSPEEVIGRSVTVLIPPELLEEELRILATLRRGGRIDHFETTRVTKHGRRLDISLSVSAIR